MRIYPDTNLKDGIKDEPFGGAAADEFGGAAWAFHDAALQELERQVIEDLWATGRGIRAKVADAVVAGDCILEDIAGADAAYTLRKASAVTYSASTTYFVGIALEPASVGAVVRILRFGVGISPSITGLAAGTAGKLTFDTTSGRLRIQTGSEPIVGTVNAKGFASLFGDVR